MLSTIKNFFDENIDDNVYFKNDLINFITSLNNNNKLKIIQDLEYIDKKKEFKNFIRTLCNSIMELKNELVNYCYYDIYIEEILQKGDTFFSYEFNTKKKYKPENKTKNKEIEMKNLKYYKKYDYLPTLEEEINFTGIKKINNEFNNSIIQFIKKFLGNLNFIMKINNRKILISFNLFIRYDTTISFTAVNYNNCKNYVSYYVDNKIDIYEKNIYDVIVEEINKKFTIDNIYNFCNENVNYKELSYGKIFDVEPIIVNSSLNIKNKILIDCIYEKYKNEVISIIFDNDGLFEHKATLKIYRYLMSYDYEYGYGLSINIFITKI